jgi:hypothetical protein
VLPPPLAPVTVGIIAAEFRRSVDALSTMPALSTILNAGTRYHGDPSLYDHVYERYFVERSDHDRCGCRRPGPPPPPAPLLLPRFPRPPGTGSFSQETFTDLVTIYISLFNPGDYPLNSQQLLSTPNGVLVKQPRPLARIIVSSYSAHPMEC